uniref:Uncharacterized protein n=1 Tax=Acrobeloides nanus TaxID=290746 RepID=A0A914D8J2_9BILA
MTTFVNVLRSEFNYIEVMIAEEGNRQGDSPLSLKDQKLREAMRKYQEFPTDMAYLDHIASICYGEI